MRFDVQRVQRMRAGHVQAVALGATELQVGAALGQPDEADWVARRIEHFYAVEVFSTRGGQMGFRAAANVTGLSLERAIEAPAAPQVAVAVHTKAVERAGPVCVDQFGLA